MSYDTYTLYWNVLFDVETAPTSLWASIWHAVYGYMSSRNHNIKIKLSHFWHGVLGCKVYANPIQLDHMKDYFVSKDGVFLS